ncbi:MFS transporter [Streptomyces sp. NPDC004647]|uniref:MFS transporter n=1 Tax=Streptomyces sp. NPDC004647 TaxID=3154671 RepID=UPI00339F24DA
MTITTAVATAGHITWLLVFANSGGDLAAQDAWAEFVGRHPDSAYNLAWYGGMHPVSYSVISPYLMSTLGVRTTMMIAGTLSAVLLALIFVRVRAVRSPLPPALVGVFAFLSNAVSGRVTFALGMMFGLAAVAVVFCWPHRWRGKRRTKAVVAALLAGLATAGSPVAGLFVGVVAAALFLSRRRPAAYALGVAPVGVVALSAWLFPFSGTQPISIWTASLPTVYAVLVFLLVPDGWKTVRIAAAVYGFGTVLTWLIDSQIGSNVTRFALVFAGPVLLATLPYVRRHSRQWISIVVALVGFVCWGSVKAAIDVVHTASAASWARELAPLLDQLERMDAEKGRVEVVPARSHREASALAPYVNLARGWNRQADLERNPLFYDGTLDSTNYRKWLRRWAVHYVVLPAVDPDESGMREAELVQKGQPYLRKVWHDAHWKLYQVRKPAPLADPPATVDRTGAGELTIHVKTAGTVLIRVAYSPWLGLVDSDGRIIKPPETDENGKGFVNKDGCLVKAEQDEAGDEWTRLLAPKPGLYRLAAPYEFPRGTPCPDSG